jgi:ribosomal protein S27E
MSEVVVVRPMIGLVYVKCPFCNTEGWIDRTGAFAPSTHFRCDGCGALFGDSLVAIQTAVQLIDTEDDLTIIMANDEIIKFAANPVKKITMEKSCFYYALVTCPFCQQQTITRYNSPQPYPAQWCPQEKCQAELVTTIWATTDIGGDVSDWYKQQPDDE